MKTVYIAIDGKEFENRKEAVDHEEFLISEKLVVLLKQLEKLSEGENDLIGLFMEYARIQSTLSNSDSFSSFTNTIDNIHTLFIK